MLLPVLLVLQVEMRRHLANVRVVQKNLVYVIGLPHRTAADEGILRRHEYFGKYGKILKVVINRNNHYNSGPNPTVSAYITFAKKSDAAMCVRAVDKSTFDGRTLRASLGTTKYCSNFLRNQPCTNPDCMYLHELGDEANSYTKQDMLEGKHQDDVTVQEQAAAAAAHHHHYHHNADTGGEADEPNASSVENDAYESQANDDNPYGEPQETTSTAGSRQQHDEEFPQPQEEKHPAEDSQPHTHAEGQPPVSVPTSDSAVAQQPLVEVGVAPSAWEPAVSAPAVTTAEPSTGSAAQARFAMASPPMRTGSGPGGHGHTSSAQPPADPLFGGAGGLFMAAPLSGTSSAALQGAPPPLLGGVGVDGSGPLGGLPPVFGTWGAPAGLPPLSQSDAVPAPPLPSLAIGGGGSLAAGASLLPVGRMDSGGGAMTNPGRTPSDAFDPWADMPRGMHARGNQGVVANVPSRLNRRVLLKEL